MPFSKPPLKLVGSSSSGRHRKIRLAVSFYARVVLYFRIVRNERNQLPVGEDLGRLVISGGLGDDLRLALSTSGVALNESAELLLDRPEIVMPEPVELSLVAVSIAALGLGDGGRLEEVFAAALKQGLALCPLATAVHLRLVHTERESGDAELRRQQPPEGALNIGSPILDPHVEVPKGFYLRTVKGQRWLRGYWCGLDVVLPPTMTYVFARAEHG